MNLCTYEDLLKGVCALAGLGFTRLQNTDRAALDQFLAFHLKACWEAEAWPDLVRAERRQFRATYASGTTYPATSEVYWPLTGLYYQALKSTTGQDPTTSAKVLNANWAVCAGSYSASDYSATKAYVVGDQVFYPSTDELYQAHTAGTGNAPTDTTKWGILTPFNRYIAWAQTGETAIGTPLAVFNLNPRVTTRTVEVRFELSHLGVTVFTNLGRVFLQFRLRVPGIDYVEYSATATYAAGDQIYWTDGNLYDVVATTTAGETPASAAAKFEVVELPAFLRVAVIRYAYADWLRANERADEAAAWQKLADQALAGEADQLFRQSGQANRIRYVA